MSLQEELNIRNQQFRERLRATEPAAKHPLYSTNEHTAHLRIEAGGGSTWIMPWHHFVFGIHQDEGERERLALTFVAHEIVLRGLNLGVLTTEIANRRLDQLRAAPGKYSKSLDEGPFVEEVHVRPLEEPPVAG